MKPLAWAIISILAITLGSWWLIATCDCRSTTWIAEQRDGKFVELNHGLPRGAEADTRTGCVYGFGSGYYYGYPKDEDVAQLWRILGVGDKAERRSFRLCGPEVKYGLGAGAQPPTPGGGGHF